MPPIMLAVVRYEVISTQIIPAEFVPIKKEIGELVALLKKLVTCGL